MNIFKKFVELQKKLNWKAFYFARNNKDKILKAYKLLQKSLDFAVRLLTVICFSALNILLFPTYETRFLQFMMFLLNAELIYTYIRILWSMIKDD